MKRLWQISLLASLKSLAVILKAAFHRDLVLCDIRRQEKKKKKNKDTEAEGEMVLEVSIPSYNMIP
jgi:hypothetical protein